MTDSLQTTADDWVNDLVIDYGFDELPYTYCPWTDDTCDHDTCITTKKCREDCHHGQ